ncbi:MAG: hypothetical protein NTY48_05505 [Candidatus Diapherotrites archaeon]|nr:hypothetical protein [Candidatus Diapherotrites archaeon]
MEIFGKKEEGNKNTSESKDEDSSSGKYGEQCSLCGKAPTDKHWAGQYFHKKCFRRMKKGAKGMI